MDNAEFATAMEEKRTSLEYMKVLAAAAEGNNRGLVKSTSVTSARSVMIELKLVDPHTFEPLVAGISTPYGEVNPAFNDLGFCTSRRDADRDPMFIAMVREYGMRVIQSTVWADELAPIVLLMAQVTNIGYVY